MNITTLQHIANNENKLSQIGSRELINSFEQYLKQKPNAVFGNSDLCPVRDFFTDGIYIREMSIPAGIEIVGKIHLYDHPTFLQQGQYYDFNEFTGLQLLEAPYSIISKKGMKRVGHTLTNVIFVTIHANPTNTKDRDELEKINFVDTYQEYDEFLKNKKEELCQQQ